MPEDTLMASLCRHIGRTVTIFTTSGGLSGYADIIGLKIYVQCRSMQSVRSDPTPRSQKRTSEAGFPHASLY